MLAIHFSLTFLSKRAKKKSREIRYRMNFCSLCLSFVQKINLGGRMTDTKNKQRRCPARAAAAAEMLFIKNEKQSHSRQLWWKMPPLFDFSTTLAKIEDFRSPKEEEWESVYQELVSNITVNDNVPILEASSIDTTTRLRQWLLNQKNKLEQLNDNQRNKIQGIIDRFVTLSGLTLEVATKKTYSRWFLKYNELNREIEKVGLSKASSYKSENLTLVHWITNQKIAMRDGKLEECQISLLQKSGIKPAAAIIKRKISAESERRWNEYYELLKAFKEKNGHCTVPAKLDLKFATWVNQQKKDFRKKVLRPDRKEKLDAIGFFSKKQK